MGVVAFNGDVAAFKDKLSKAKGGVVVDFFAEWCGPCKMITPKLQAMAEQYGDVLFLKVDVDDSQDVAQEYKVAAMPTLIGFLNGDKVDQVVGADMTKIEALVQKVNKPLAFSGAALKLGESDGMQASDAASREARAKAAEARMAGAGA